MEPTIFRFIFKYSKREQILLLVMTGISFPFLYVSLDLPKTIINRALKAGEFTGASFAGIEFSDQIVYLLTLCFAFLALVCVNGGFKYYINVFRGQLGERMLRRLRYELYSRVLRFPLPQFRRVSQGEIIPMITQEVEPLGGFIGDSVALPAFQGGTLLTIVIFMFIQDPILGTAAVALYPIQGYIIPKMQRKVNALGKQRVRNVRKLSERIGETIAGVQEIHAHDGSRLALAVYTQRLNAIYDIRFEIYRRKFFIKFLNNFIAQLTPFFFYSIGGYLVIKGDLSIGALVAVLAAYKDLSAPWKELLNYYQQKEDSRIKYEQVIEQFDPAGIMDEQTLLGEPSEPISLDGPIQAANVTLLDEESQPIVEGVSLTVEPGEKLAIVGPSGGGRDIAAMLLARLYLPSSGQITVGGRDLITMPEAITGRHIAYVGPSAFVFSSTIRENLLLGAKHQPKAPAELDADAATIRDKEIEQAEITGNSVDDLTADWIDYDAIGVADAAALSARLADLLALADLDEDVYALGLRGTIDPEKQPDVAERILEARGVLRERMEAPELAELVEPFDESRFNTNASVAENLLFGTPVGPTFDLEHLAGNDYVRSVLAKMELVEPFIAMGREIATTMVELFADLPSDHEFFAQYSFISSDDLPEFQILLGRADRLGLAKMDPADRDRFLSLPFKLIPSRHRLGLIDEAMVARILEARRVFAEGLPDDLKGALEFFSTERYNAAASLQDNILFGKIAYGQANAGDRVGKVLAEVIRERDLRPVVIQVGLEFECGISGSRLTAAQRQKIGIARALLRRPRVVILNEATAALDAGSQTKVLDRLLPEVEGKTLIMVMQSPRLAERMDRTAVMRGGRVVETGTWAELSQSGTALSQLLGSE